MALLNPGSCFGERKTPRHLLLQEPCSQVRAPANYWCLALIVILLTCTVILWVDRQQEPIELVSCEGLPAYSFNERAPKLLEI